MVQQQQQLPKINIGESAQKDQAKHIQSGLDPKHKV
jgi:hypothetical protein